MKIEALEFLQFFDEHIQLSCMSYGQFAYRLKTDQVEIEFHFNKIGCSAELVINSGIKQFIKVSDIKEIESSFSEFVVTQSNGKFIKLTKGESFSFFISI